MERCEVFIRHQITIQNVSKVRAICRGKFASTLKAVRQCALIKLESPSAGRVSPSAGVFNYHIGADGRKETYAKLRQR